MDRSIQILRIKMDGRGLIEHQKITGVSLIGGGRSYEEEENKP
jgi:hypothetical protein